MPVPEVSGRENVPMSSVNATEEGEWEERIGRAAEDCEALRAAYEDELEVRDRLIVDALDAGWTRGKVSRWARLSPARITRIVARRGAVEAA
jgi:hypothetical protein